MKALKFFTWCTILASAICETLVIMTGQSVFMILLMFMPAIVAILTKCVFCRKENKVLHFNLCNVKYLCLAILLPIFYLGLPYVIYWCITPDSMNMEWTLSLIVTFASSSIMNIVLTLGEEIGWRGFFLPRLAFYMGEKKALIASGAFWGIWHLPLLFAGLYMPNIPLWYKIPIFMIVITDVGVIIGTITLRAKSVWPAVLLHAVHNTVDQDIFGAGTKGAVQSYFVSEAGIFTAIIVVIIAVLFLAKLSVNNLTPTKRKG